MKRYGGTVFFGRKEGDRLGYSLAAAGDVNGDGFEDLIFGAPYASRRKPDGSFDPILAGETLLLFGQAGEFAPEVGLDTIGAGTGFVVEERQEAFAALGMGVGGAGDLNGDGFDDLVFGAPYADRPDRDGDDQGAAWLVFGSADGQPVSQSPEAAVNRGAHLFEANLAASYAGFAATGVGDINGDGFDDAAIGLPGHTHNGLAQAGGAAIVFGGEDLSDLPSAPNDIEAGAGIRLLGETSQDYAGGSIAAAGDFNADGIDDLVLGATFADGNSFASGAAYVVLGHRDPLESINIGTAGPRRVLKLSGTTTSDATGVTVDGAGDVNGDGFDDVIVGTRQNGKLGAAYVVFGHGVAPARELDLGALDGQNGFRLDGQAVDDLFGASVAGVGDVNQDGFDDVLVGAFQATTGLLVQSGAAYLIFGSADGYAGQLSVTDLDGTNGYRFDGADHFDAAGITVSAAGDQNMDGAADFLIAADRANRPGEADNGAVYLTYGGKTRLTRLDSADGVRDGVINLADLGTELSLPDLAHRMGTGGNNTQTGAGGADQILGLGGDDRIAGKGGADVLFGGDDRDRIMGGNGRDHIDGGDGWDKLHGQAGNDVIHGGDRRDVIEGDRGNDTIYAGQGSDMVRGGDGRDTVWGGRGADTLRGDRHGDTLRGGAGNDEIRGGSEADRISGGTGDDTIWGGTGKDIFQFHAGFERDVIQDFEIGTDRLDFRDHVGVGALDDLEIVVKSDRLLLEDGSDGTVILLGISAGQIDEESFLF